MIPPYLLPVLAMGALGSVTRYLVDSFVSARLASPFPWGTFVVNMSGSLLLGFLTGWAVFAGGPTAAKVILGTGFCGAYTTFSTLSFETVRLIEERSIYEAVANVLGSVLLGLVAAGTGLALGAWV
jgi:CrcB protein